MTLKSSELSRCFQGIIPSVIATCSEDGTPNITYLSELHLVDERHVALSCQFFNKTAANLRVNPFARVEVYDPITFEAYRLGIRFTRSETTGALFDTMSARIDAIAAQTGLTGIFRLRSADVCEVLSVERVEAFIRPPSANEAPLPLPTPGKDPVSELRSLQVISDRINRADDLEALLDTTLETLSTVLGFQHAILLVPDEGHDQLVAIASRGYEEAGIGATVPFGVGLVGAAAARKVTLRMAVGAELRYRRAIRRGVQEIEASEVAMPGLADPQSEIAVPLLVSDELVGVLVVESAEPCAFSDWHEAFIGIVGNQIAMAIDRLSHDASEEDACPEECQEAVRDFCFYANDDCVFVDGEYLIRNVPGKILWKVLNAYHREGRTEFTNRELRLDPSLGLPPIKDNLESRLILLKKRLEQKCPDVKIVSTGRGKFALQLSSAIALTERTTG